MAGEVLLEHRTHAYPHAIVVDQIGPSRKERLMDMVRRMDASSMGSYNLVERIRQRAHITNDLHRAALAELFATGFLLFTGGCVNAQYIISKTKMDEWIGVTVGWGLCLFFAVTMAHRISGAHLNPAVSFFQLTQGKISPVRFIVFVIAQNIGAFLGAMFCFLVYYDAINNFDQGDRQVTGPHSTAQIFATYPAPYLSTLGACFDQVMGTAVLCISVATITDRRNRVPPFVQPGFVAMAIMMVGMCLGMNAGYAVNPARDFAPRLFSLIAGYGWRVFSYRDYRWFWVPIICPMIGGALGAWIYEGFIGFHMPDDPETTLDEDIESCPRRVFVSSPPSSASPVHQIVDDRGLAGDLREVHLAEKRPYAEHQQYHPELQQ